MATDDRTTEHGGVPRREFLRQSALLGLASAGVGRALQGPAAAQTTQKRELVVAQGGDVARFDPHMSTGAPDIRVSFNIFDNLISRRADDKLYPGLATEWKATDPETWTFKLRQGVKWHNGDPFTSADAKFSIERTYGQTFKTQVALALSTVDRVDAPDPYTLIVKTKKPDPLLPGRLAYYGGQIVPKKYLEQVGNDTFNVKPIGTGPLRFASWVKDDKAVLEANPDYWGGKVDVDRVVFRPIPETAPRVAALMKGEADVIIALSPDHYDRVNQGQTTRVASALYAGLYVLAVNSKVKPLDNPLVKKAMALAVDREAIVKELWRGRGILPNGPIAKGDNHYDASLPALRYDPKEARDLLKKAGYNGEPIYLETTVGYVVHDKAMAEAIQGMWKDVGINLVVEVIEYSVRAQKVREKSIKGLLWSDPTSTLRDPDGMMWRLLGPGGTFDYWRHGEWDELGNSARFSMDEAFRGRAYKRMTEIFLEQWPWIPILQPYEDYGVQKHVEWTPNANQQLELRRFNFRMKRA
jgi:peptide/nickel transport system substrate-binding protein